MAVYGTDNLLLFMSLKLQESPPRLVPSHPDIGKADIITTQQSDGNQSGPVARSVNGSRSSSTASSKVCVTVYWV